MPEHVWEAQVKILEREEQEPLEISVKYNHRIRISISSRFPLSRWMLKKMAGSGNALLEDDPSFCSIWCPHSWTLFSFFFFWSSGVLLFWQKPQTLKNNP